MFARGGGGGGGVHVLREALVVFVSSWTAFFLLVSKGIV